MVWSGQTWPGLVGPGQATYLGPARPPHRARFAKMSPFHSKKARFGQAKAGQTWQRPANPEQTIIRGEEM